MNRSEMFPGFMESMRKKKDLLLPMVLSALLNFGGKVLIDNSHHLEAGLTAISRGLKDLTRGEQQTELKETLKENLRDLEKKEKLGEVRLRKFFLDSELAEGISAFEYDDADKKIDQLVEKFKGMVGKDFELKILHEMVQEQGRYEPKLSYLSDVVNDREGNCEARTKLMLVLLQEVFPDSNVKVQEFAEHFRVLVQVGDEWYSMEKPTLKKVELKDLENTALHGRDMFIRFYLGQNKGRVISAVKVEKTGKIMPGTDTYFKSSTDKSKLKDYSDIAPVAEEKEVRYNYEETHPERLMIRFKFAEAKTENENQGDVKAVERKELDIFTIDDDFIAKAILKDQVYISSKKVTNPERLFNLFVHNWGIVQSNITDFSFLNKDLYYKELILYSNKGIKFETLRGIKTEFLDLRTNLSDKDTEFFEGTEIEFLNLRENTKLRNPDFLGKIHGLEVVDLFLTKVMDFSVLNKYRDLNFRRMIVNDCIDFSTLKGLSIENIEFRNPNASGIIFADDFFEKTKKDDRLWLLADVKDLNILVFKSTEIVDFTGLPRDIKYGMIILEDSFVKPRLETFKNLVVETLLLRGLDLKNDDLQKMVDSNIQVKELDLMHNIDLTSCKDLARLNLRYLNIRQTSIRDLRPLAEKIEKEDLMVVYDLEYVLNRQTWQLEEKAPE